MSEKVWATESCHLIFLKYNGGGWIRDDNVVVRRLGAGRRGYDVEACDFMVE